MLRPEKVNKLNNPQANPHQMQQAVHSMLLDLLWFRQKEKMQTKSMKNLLN
ncbi:MAG: hypothetical protein V8R83_05370 [Candidatus Gastranaerophilaceae bacterium]